MPPEHEILRMAQRTLERLRRMGEIPPEDEPPSECNRGRETPAIGGPSSPEPATETGVEG